MRIVKAPDERKQEILNGAIRVFARKGYDRTSITDIANEIHISQGLCYRYFASKEEIYDAAIEEYASYIAETNMNNYDYKDMTLKEQIAIMSGNLSRYSSVERDKQELYELFHQNGNHKMHDELFFKVGEHLIPFITKIIAKAKENGETKVADPKSTAYFLIYGQIGILQRKDLSLEEKQQMIQNCAMELLGQ